jgi:two-component system heavy metal sensor histidine kinase CusS
MPRLARLLRRADLRLGITLATAIALLMAGLLGVLFLVSSHEASEVLEGTLEAEIRGAAEQLASHPHVQVFSGPHPGVTVRQVDAAGGSRVLFGRWSREGRVFQDGVSTVRLAFAGPRDWFAEELPLPDGGRLEGRIRLTGFVHERREQLAQIATSFGIGLLGVIVVSWFATRMVLSPLRRTTRAIEDIDDRHLGARIPVRGTDDDLDRHADALNRVLARLQDSFARMEAFGADVAHELRTPVNRVLNLADVALLRGDRDSDTRSLEAIRNAAEEMRRLIDDLLLLALGDDGRLAVRPEPTDLSGVVDDLVELYRPSCEERGGPTLAWQRPPRPVEAVTDRHLLQRAFSNLLDNAVRHTPGGGRIEVGVARDQDCLRIGISDSGVGISLADRERIFDRFVQLDTSRSRGGAGLGLPIARMIARSLGGDVAVGDSPLGGARFEIVLPSAPQAGASA